MLADSLDNDLSEAKLESSIDTMFKDVTLFFVMVKSSGQLH